MYELLLTDKEILLLDLWIDAVFRNTDYAYNVFGLGKSCGKYEIYIIFDWDLMNDSSFYFNLDEWDKWAASKNYTDYGRYYEYLYPVTAFLECLWDDVQFIEDLIDVSADDIKTFNGIMDRYHIDPALRL